MISDFFLALLLALIQGLTEFLPVSSSAHLLFPSLLFGAKDFGIVFDISVHAGTLAAVIYYFKKEIQETQKRAAILVKRFGIHRRGSR